MSARESPCGAGPRVTVNVGQTVRASDRSGLSGSTSSLELEEEASASPVVLMAGGTVAWRCGRETRPTTVRPSPATPSPSRAPHRVPSPTTPLSPVLATPCCLSQVLLHPHDAAPGPRAATPRSSSPAAPRGHHFSSPSRRGPCTVEQCRHSGTKP